MTQAKGTRKVETATEQVRCSECGGSGHLPEYAHVCGGRCFACGGSGHERTSRGRPRADVSTGHFDHEHVTAFQEALQIEHVFAWIEQDYAVRSRGSRY